MRGEASTDSIETLRWLLASPPAPRATRAHAQAFLEYIAQTPGVSIEIHRDPDDALVAAAALCLPGRTAVLLLPPAQTSVRLATCAQELLDRLSPRGLHYVQGLVDPECAWQGPLLSRLGFDELACLSYQQRDAAYPWVDPPVGQWRNYQDAGEEEFGAVIEQTYIDSRDCEKLLGARPMSDVLASHRASGRFDAHTWEILLEGGRPAGVILLSRIFQGSEAEVVYMGVCPEFRGRGFANRLMARALHLCRSVGARTLTLVVDDSNVAAVKLYARLGFIEVGRRVAWWKRGSA